MSKLLKPEDTLPAADRELFDILRHPIIACDKSRRDKYIDEAGAESLKELADVAAALAKIIRREFRR